MFTDDNRYVPVPEWNPTDWSGGGGGGDLSNYYTKTQTDALLNQKQQRLVAGEGITITGNTIASRIIDDTITSTTTTWSSQDLYHRFLAIAGMTDIKVVATLPGTPARNTLYYVGSATPYTMILVDSDGVQTNLGTTEINLSDYYTKTQMDSKLASDYFRKAQVIDMLNEKQDTLVSGTNIRTINGNSLVGSGDINISAAGTLTSKMFVNSKTITQETGSVTIRVTLDEGYILTGACSSSEGGVFTNYISVVNPVSGNPRQYDFSCWYTGNSGAHQIKITAFGIKLS